MELFIVPFTGQGTFPIYLQTGSFEELSGKVCHRLGLPDSFRDSNALKYVTNAGKWLTPTLARTKDPSTMMEKENTLHVNDNNQCTHHNTINLVGSNNLHKMQRMEGVTDGTTIHLCLLLRGGKGGFGTQLRLKSKQRGPKRTTNFGACRDLNGRRLRHVNDEILLAKWKEAREKGEKFDASQGTTRGIDGWFMGVPNWADLQGVVANAMLSKTGQKKAARTSRYKTSLCTSWLAARSNGRTVPAGAPRHYGCPQGTRCRFAHGEEELQGQAAIEYRKRIEDEKLAKKQAEKDQYMSVDSDNYYKDESILSMVQAGLGQAKKRAKREGGVVADDGSSGLGKSSGSSGSTCVIVDDDDDDDDDEEGEEEAPEGLGAEHLDKLASLPIPASSSDYSGAFHLQCVRGDVDVTTASNEVRDVYTCEGISTFGTVAMLSPGSPPSTSTSTDGDSSTWCYEVTVVSGGLAQIGWAEPGCSILQGGSTASTSRGGDEGKDEEGEDGCGDDSLSYGYDGSRGLAWHGTSSAYPPTQATAMGSKRSSEDMETGGGDGGGGKSEGSETLWKAGDVVTTLLAVSPSSQQGKGSNVQISYTLNGIALGIAFNRTIGTHPGVCPFIPCISLEAKEVVAVNLGGKAFSHPPAEGQPVLGASFPTTSTSSASSSSNTLPSARFSNSSTTTTTLPGVSLEDLQDPVAYPSALSLEAVGHDVLKAALSAKGVKVGGNLQEKAKRYVQIRGMDEGDIPAKLKSKRSELT